VLFCNIKIINFPPHLKSLSVITYKIYLKIRL